MGLWIRLACGHEFGIDSTAGKLILNTSRRCRDCRSRPDGKMPRRAVVAVLIDGRWTERRRSKARPTAAPPAGWRGLPPASVRQQLIVVPAHELDAKRRELIEAGWTEELVAKYVTTPFEAPDDTGFAPAPHDRLLHGPARATGVAADVVKRRSTIRRTDYLDRSSGACHRRPTAG